MVHSRVAAAAKADAVDVWLGAAWLTLEHGGGQVVQAVSVTRHAQWNGTTAENDIATVKLQVAVIKSGMQFSGNPGEFDALMLCATKSALAIL